MVDDAVDLCIVDPGHDVDLRVRADLRSLTQVWMGDRPMADALSRGDVVLDGPRALVRRFPGWLGQHPILASVQPGVAPASRAASVARTRGITSSAPVLWAGG